MFKINSSGATSDGRFKEAPAPATRLDSNWLNALQDELANVITAPIGGNAALNTGDNAQLLAAIVAIAGRAVSINVGEKSVQIGPLIIKLGATLGSFNESTVYTAFATPFPNACWGAFPVARNDTGSIDRNIWTQLQGEPGIGGFNTKLQLSGGAGVNNIDGFNWIAIGH